ncbi:MAG: methyltransferase domain-containing protein [Pseudomonadota bacterium]
MRIEVNGETIDLARYEAFHAERFKQTLETVRALGGGRVVELGGHPWAMTARLLAEQSVTLAATVSAEEVSLWPDALPVTRRSYTLEQDGAPPRGFENVSANLERTRFDIGGEPADLVLACEIIEHLTRAPHVMLLNANAWLKPGGRILITTPNGAQFENPLRFKSKTPSYRANVYGRHNHLFTLEHLTDLAACCGFVVERAELVSPYPRRGPARLYKTLGRLPGRFFREKFNQSLLVVARKTAALEAATRLPKVYAPSPQWECIAPVA